MNFNFIPYSLNADLLDLKDAIRYLATDNGIDLYKAISNPTILGILVTDVNLYFFEGTLITVYIHLAGNGENFRYVRQIFEGRIKEEGKAFEIDLGEVIGWENKSEFLGLVYDRIGNRLYLYYTIREHSIYYL